MKTLRTVSLAAMLLCLAGPAFAGPIFTVDENGNGFEQNGSTITPLPFHLGKDPANPTGPDVLIYTLPFAGTPGDAALGESEEFPSDVIRFNGDGTLIFYSDTDGVDSIGDVGIPLAPLTPFFFALEQPNVGGVSVEGANGLTYTPLLSDPFLGGATDPGFDPSGPTYIFVSDGIATPPTIPEPSTLAILTLSLAGMAGYSVWQRRRAGMRLALLGR
jgi:hypothetical protein